MSWRGHVFYELTDEEEDITDDKELILLKIKVVYRCSIYILHRHKEETHACDIIFYRLNFMQNKEKANIPDTTEQISKKEVNSY